jgi:hypothetical protein
MMSTTDICVVLVWVAKKLLQSVPGNVVLSAGTRIVRNKNLTSEYMGIELERTMDRCVHDWT